MPRWVRTLVVAAAVMLVAAGGTVGTAVLLAGHYEKKVGRDDVLAQVAALPAITEPAQWLVTNSAAPVTPPAAAGVGENLLILGVDTRAGWTQHQSRSDTIMLVHVDAAKTRAAVVSFPRDSYVYIPPVTGKWGGGRTKINAAYAWGGAPLVVQVLDHLTGVPIDHVIRVDFAAIRAITTIVGGVDVTVRRTVRDKRTGYTFPAGVNHLDGKTAEVYVRQRYGLPDGDFDRVKRQQQYLHALAEKVVSMGVLTNPVTLNRLLSTAAKSLVVDQTLDLTGTVRELSGLRPDDLDFTTIPSSGFVHVAAGTANRLDETGCQALFAALRGDTMAGYFAAHGHPSYGASSGA
jgi:LCP family protein required for cell wall assembly